MAQQFQLKDIDRPLGQPGRTARPRSAFGARDIAILAGAAVVFGVSALVALQEEPFRSPPVAAVTKPVTAEAAAENAAPEPPQPTASETRAGPSIVKVQPETAPSGKSVIVIRDPSALAQDLRVAHIPDPALVEESEHGLLPVRAADGRRPFDVYARPWSGSRGPKVAIVVGGLGLSQTGTQAAIEALPAEVTLGFAPQGNSLDRWMQAARRKGHELVLQLPLEPFDYPNVDPGRHTLTVAAAGGENLDDLHWLLGRMTNYVGVMNYMGARFTGDRAAMGALMREIGSRGLLYLDDGSSARSLAPELAPANRVPLAGGDAIIDGERERAAILKKLDELERAARAGGFAVGIGSAFDVTVEAVTQWVAEAKRRGIEIVPVSAVAADPERN